MNDNAIPTPMCDIVLKGGLTSGVVYDYLRLELNQDYKPAAVGMVPTN